MNKLNKKYVIGTHVMFFEIEMYKDFIDGLVNLLETVENKENVIIDLCFNMSEILEKINESQLNISVVYTQPPKKSSRGMKVQKTPIQVKSELLGLPIRAPNSLKNNIDEYIFNRFVKPLGCKDNKETFK